MRDDIRRVAIEDVVAGARLAEPVCDVNGNVLLPAGAELSDSTRASLVRRGLTELTIVFERVPSEAERVADLARVEARLTYLFRSAGDNAAGQHLLRLMRRYRGWIMAETEGASREFLLDRETVLKG